MTVKDFLDRLVAKLIEQMERDDDSDYGAVSVVRMAVNNLSETELERVLNSQQRQQLLAAIQDLDMGPDGEDLERGKDELIDLIRAL